MNPYAGRNAPLLKNVRGGRAPVSTRGFPVVGNGLGGAPRRKWTLAKITTALWFDAADADTITLNGSKVIQWDDKSGRALHATQGTAAEQPSYGASGVTFDGTNSLVVPDNEAIQFGTEEFFLCIVGEVVNPSKGPTSQNTYISKNFSGGFEVYNYQGSLGLYVGGTANNAFIEGAVFANSSEVIACSRTGTTIKIEVKSGASASSTNSASSSNVGQNLIIGHRPGGTSSFRLIGKIKEIVIVKGLLSSADQGRIKNYLARKWGL